MDEDRRKHNRPLPDRRRQTLDDTPLSGFVAVAALAATLLVFIWLSLP